MPLNLKKHAAALAASAAALTMAAQPAYAAQSPQVSAASGPTIATTYSSDRETAYQYRSYDRYDRRGRYRRHRGPSTSDVVAGVLVLGTIAAILGSGKSKNDRSRTRGDDRNRDSRRDNAGYSSRNSRDGYQSNGMNNAVDMCADQVERGDDSIANVDNASRNANGWNVSGRMENGTRFDCWIDNNGRIRSVDLGGAVSSNSSGRGGYNSAQMGAQGTQHSDNVYARARAANGGSGYNVAQSSPAVEDRSNVDQDLYANDPRPAYPGGPLPGEAGYQEALGG